MENVTFLTIRNDMKKEEVRIVKIKNAMFKNIEERLFNEPVKRFYEHTEIRLLFDTYDKAKETLIRLEIFKD